MNIQKFEATTMSSREIAELTGKEHKHVKRDIEVMLHDLGGDTTKFGRIYKDSMNRDQTEYMLPKNECLTLISGYSAKLRHAIIVRWQELESQNSRPLTQMEIVLAHAQRLVDMEREQNQMKAQITALVDGENFLTIVGYCNLTNRRLDQKETSRIGKLASKLCKLQGINTGRARHPVYGEVNSYPFEILAEVFGD